MNKYNVNRSAESQHFFEENVQYRINVKKWVVGQIANSVPSTYPKSYIFYNNISGAGYCYFNTVLLNSKWAENASALLKSLKEQWD